MSSDQDYMAFLNQANEDPSRGTAKAQGQGGKTKIANEIRKIHHVGGPQVDSVYV